MSRIIYYEYGQEELDEKDWHELYVNLRGWSDIIKRLIDDLFDLGWNGQLFQIKEKFGGLRFYIGGGTADMCNRITQAESESLKTCVECGRPGKQVNCGYVLTLCSAHSPKSWRSFELLDSDSDSDSPAV